VELAGIADRRGGQRRAEQERLAWRELAEALVAELHELSQPLAKRACEAIFTDPAEPTPNLPRAGVDPSVALGQESEAQQAAMTRLARFDRLRGGIEAQLMAGLANLSQAFLVKAEEQVATTNTAVMLTFDLTVGPAAPRCGLTCDERTAGLGDTLLAMWFDTVVQPLSEHLRRIAAGAECFTESCSEARIARLRQAVTVMEVEARFAALRQQYLAQPPAWAAPSVEATLPPTASATSQEAAETTTAATDTKLEPESYSPAVADAISLLATPSLQSSAEDAPCAPGGSDMKHRLLWRLWPAGPEHEGAEEALRPAPTASSATKAKKYARVVLLTSFIVCLAGVALAGFLPVGAQLQDKVSIVPPLSCEQPGVTEHPPNSTCERPEAGVEEQQQRMAAPGRTNDVTDPAPFLSSFFGRVQALSFTVAQLAVGTVIGGRRLMM
jgi:hypothetical protein